MTELLGSSDIYWDGRHYDRINEFYTQDLPFYFSQTTGLEDPILELACGTGRLTIPFAQRGYKITGLDQSHAMLKVAAQKTGNRLSNLELVLADARSFALDRRFGLILFPFNALTHLLTAQDLGDCLHCVANHLTGSGRLIIDVFNPSLTILTRPATTRYPVRTYLDPDGRGVITVTETNWYDRATQINHLTWYFHYESGAEEQITWSMRMWFPQELDALLQYHGFRIAAKYGNYDATPFLSDSPHQLVVCKSLGREGIQAN